ncbi:hypothetical protein [Streptomyces tricolor]|uniref:hypothetical protein n=1 Tax=Streptomyces tricolor TaxID=68277 RepID=UPI0036E26EF0
MEVDDTAEPLPPLDEELFTRHERVFRGKPVRCDPQGIKRGVVDIGPVETAHDLQRLHAGRCKDLPVSIPPRGCREERMRHGAEEGRDDRLIEVVRHLA